MYYHKIHDVTSNILSLFSHFAKTKVLVLFGGLDIVKSQFHYMLNIISACTRISNFKFNKMIVKF